MLERIQLSLPRLGRFSLRVLRRFRANNGILLASAVGYNFALSLVPLFTLVLIVLSHFLEEEVPLELVTTWVRVLIPSNPEQTRETLRSFMDQREVAGVLGLGAMLLFSSIAFRVLESAMRVIFRHHARDKERTFMVSALLPFAFTGALALLLVVVTGAIAGLNAIDEATLLPGPATLLGFAGYALLVALFAAFYRLLPVGRISGRRALAGGLVAATLWELIRLLLSWYFGSVSLVGSIYGSLATVVVLLLSMEIAAIVLLLGAQVIAELEVSANASMPWYVEPPAPSAKEDAS